MNIQRSVALGFLCATSMWASTTAHMQYISTINPGGVFLFEVDGDPLKLFCEQFLPNYTTEPYTAIVATLGDLTGTALYRAGDPLALQKYQQVAILDLRAYADPTLEADVVRANRRIVDGVGPLTNQAQMLYDWVQMQNPADYDLSGFRIYANEFTQELGGFDFPPGQDTTVPEPSTAVLIATGLAVAGVIGRFRGSRNTDSKPN